MYQENQFSPAATEQSIKAAKERVLQFMKTVSVKPKTLSNEVAQLLVGQLLTNFHLLLNETFQRPPHQKATMGHNLQQIVVQNEYDVQHLLYGLLKPIFPMARTEVVEDAGYRGIRYDIVINEYDLTIETKCTRSSMTEKKLMEEIAADSFHYKKGIVYFFIYDRVNMIRNKEAFEAMYSAISTDKMIQTIVLQPTILK